MDKIDLLNDEVAVLKGSKFFDGFLEGLTGTVVAVACLIYKGGHILQRAGEDEGKDFNAKFSAWIADLDEAWQRMETAMSFTDKVIEGCLAVHPADHPRMAAILAKRDTRDERVIRIVDRLHEMLGPLAQAPDSVRE